jgi:hypothetical protein
MTSNAMNFFAPDSEDQAHLSESEIFDLYDEDDGDEDFQVVMVMMKKPTVRMEGADSSLPNAFDRLRVSDNRNFNSVKLLN